MSFAEKINGLVKGGVSLSKKVFLEVKDQAVESTRIGALTVELNDKKRALAQLERKCGIEVFHLLIEEEKKSISQGSGELREILDQIQQARQEIRIFEDKMNKES